MSYATDTPRNQWKARNESLVFDNLPHLLFPLALFSIRALGFLARPLSRRTVVTKISKMRAEFKMPNVKEGKLGCLVLVILHDAKKEK